MEDFSPASTLGLTQGPVAKAAGSFFFALACGELAGVDNLSRSDGSHMSSLDCSHHSRFPVERHELDLKCLAVAVDEDYRPNVSTLKPLRRQRRGQHYPVQLFQHQWITL